jgi:PadR family transcriptional regulator AphA
MSLPHVILTVLSTREATGYDITKEFSHSIGYFWKASHQQVYRELNKMALLICGVHNSLPMQQQLESLIDESHNLIGHYQELEQIHFSDYKNMDRQQRLDRLTLRRGLHNRQAWILWAEEVLTELKDMDSEGSAVAIN